METGGNSGMRRGRGSLGFTMVEMMATLGLLAVLAGLVGVSVSNMLANMQQVELDGMARQVFVAAQNHLAQADGASALSKRRDLGIEGPDGSRYLVVSPGDARLDRGSVEARESVLYDMLPAGSMDEDIRSDSAYVIKYSPGSANVEGVFFSHGGYAPPFAAKADGFRFIGDDCDRLFGEDGYEGAGKKAARQRYESASGATVIVGYFGGEALESGSLSFDAPRLRMVNAEKLTAVVDNPGSASTHGFGWASTGSPELSVVVEGAVSGKAKTFKLYSGNMPNFLDDAVTTPDGGATFFVDLDDVTREGGHFDDMFGPEGFIPGEDVDVQAVVYSNHELSNIAKSAKVRVNSLFGSVVSSSGRAAGAQGTPSQQGAPAAAGGKTTTLRVSSVRHLANLSGDVSGYSPEAINRAADTKTASGAPALQAVGSLSGTYDEEVSVKQAVDLSWPDFQASVASNASALETASKPVPGESTQSASSVSVTACSGASAIPVEPGSFMPLSPSFALSYDGTRHELSGFRVVRESGDVGLFAELNGGSVTGLDIVDSEVSTANGQAGTLSAVIEGASVSDVSVWASSSDGPTAYASSNAGGLVGTAKSSSVADCSSSAYVSAAAGPAGGLVGHAEGSSITRSYCSGHTQNGRFPDSDVGAARHNVSSGFAAGGLVGTGSGLSVSACYATCSVSGTRSGGLAGSVSGSFSNCYATGAVFGEQAGAFASTFSGTAQGNFFLASAVAGLPSSADGTEPASPADATTDGYRSFAGGTGAALPYDQVLSVMYSGAYPLKTIRDLSGEGSGFHRGDWQGTETLTVNVTYGGE